MNWYRITLTDGSTCFYEINLDVDGLISEMHENHPLKIERTIVLIPHNQNNKQGLIAVEPKKINPMFMGCDDKKEYICANKIVSFGVIDVDSEAWTKIYESVYQESNLVKPNMRLVLPE